MPAIQTPKNKTGKPLKPKVRFYNPAIEEGVNSLEKTIEEIASSQERARQFLIDAGIFTPKGKLSKPYKVK